MAPAVAAPALAVDPAAAPLDHEEIMLFLRIIRNIPLLFIL
jgi:hypothetical protein